MLNEDQRNAVEVIVEQRAAERRPEYPDGNLPDLEDPRREKWEGVPALNRSNRAQRRPERRRGGRRMMCRGGPAACAGVHGG